MKVNTENIGVPLTSNTTNFQSIDSGVRFMNCLAIDNNIGIEYKGNAIIMDYTAVGNRSFDILVRKDISWLISLYAY